MSSQKINPRTIILVLLMFVAAGLRVVILSSDDLSPFANFTPLGAMALFGGHYFKGKTQPFLFPLLTLFISDLVLSFTIYTPYRVGLLYTGWFWVYLAFALMVIAGKILLKKLHAVSLLISILAITLIHWLVSDIGGCISTSTNETYLAVYVQRLIAAIPYELNFLAGTLLYGIVMFGSFELIEKQLLRSRMNKSL